ncbi:MAG: hypothetical protein SFZ03_02370 [Candidatus Melainabacteria bacterium]|nr:hypothetical protein [Candidatus Melainabacteria bacterium]
MTQWLFATQGLSANNLHASAGIRFATPALSPALAMEGVRFAALRGQPQGLSEGDQFQSVFERLEKADPKDYTYDKLLTEAISAYGKRLRKICQPSDINALDDTDIQAFHKDTFGAHKILVEQLLAPKYTDGEVDRIKSLRFMMNFLSVVGTEGFPQQDNAETTQQFLSQTGRIAMQKTTALEAERDQSPEQFEGQKEIDYWRAIDSRAIALAVDLRRLEERAEGIVENRWLSQPEQFAEFAMQLRDETNGYVAPDYLAHLIDWPAGQWSHFHILPEGWVGEIRKIKEPGDYAPVDAWLAQQERFVTDDPVLKKQLGLGQQEGFVTLPAHYKPAVPPEKTQKPGGWLGLFRS